MNSEPKRGIGRRRLVGWGGLAVAGTGLAAAGLTTAGTAEAGTSPIPPDARPGGAYDRLAARLAAEGRFAGVVLLAHRGRTVLSRAYGMADRERKIRIRPDTAFNLSSASQPFLAVAVLHLLQQGRLALSDPVGRHLTGLDPEVAAKVTVHHVLLGVSGLDAPEPDYQRVFRSRDEVRQYVGQWVARARLAGVPGSTSNGHTAGAGVGQAMAARIVEELSGQTFWAYVEEHVFRRAGMRGSGYYTRDRWLTDERLAHPYMAQDSGGVIDAIRHLDAGSTTEYLRGRNPGRAYIGHASGDGFATAPDLVRFATALAGGTLLAKPYAALFTEAKQPGPDPTSFDGYTMPVSIVNGQYTFGRGGGAPGVGANWTVYADTGWVGVVLTNDDRSAMLDLLVKEAEVVTGAPVGPPGGGG